MKAASLPHLVSVYIDFFVTIISPDLPHHSPAVMATVNMAPCRPTASAKPANKKPAIDSNKVVKRPARGYHKFKNGLLNATPKGQEVEL